MSRELDGDSCVILLDTAQGLDGFPALSPHDMDLVLARLEHERLVQCVDVVMDPPKK